MKTKQLLLSATLILGALTANAQSGNFGIGVAIPTNKLHVKPTTVDPARFEGLQTATDPEVVTTDANGVIHKATIASLTTSSTANSGGYVNSCGCTDVATVTITRPFTSGDALDGTDATVEVPMASIATALSNNPAACDIAISFPTVTINSASPTSANFADSYLDVMLPPAANYAGRGFTIHPALPFQASIVSSSSQAWTFYLAVHVPAGTLVGITYNQGSAFLANVEYFYPTATTNAIGGINIQAGASVTIPANTLRRTGTINVYSDGFAWIGSEEASPCIVTKP